MTDTDIILESIFEKSVVELKHAPKLFDRVITGVIRYHITTEKLNLSGPEYDLLEKRVIATLNYTPSQERFGSF